jgi:alpha-ketoglutarate-dependent taurine dioxygenase
MMAGLLGAVVQYNADHTFVMYPPCGAKKDDLRKAGFHSINGTWELTETGELIAKLEANGKSMKIETKLTWQDDQMVLTNSNGSVASKSGRYLGALPPSC